MESLLTAVPPRVDPAAELIDLSCPEDPFQRMKACSVVTYGESTLLRLPWSGLHRRNERGMSSLSLDFPKQSSSGRWNVSSAAPSLVGTYERSVFRALEWIAIDASLVQGLPFRNPLVVHPREICERLCWRATQTQFEAIEQAMQSLCRIEIEETGVKRGTPPRRIGLLRSVIAGTQRNVNRSLTCPQFVVYFDRFFVDSVNAGWIRPLNWGLWISLRDPVAQRLLEIIDPEFARLDGQGSVAVDSDALSRLLPLNPALSRSRRRILLEQAHAALIHRGYLRKVARIASGASDICRYHPGPTYRAMQLRLEKEPGIHAYRRLLRDITQAVGS
jgi:hypothetical protein